MTVSPIDVQKVTDVNSSVDIEVQCKTAQTMVTQLLSGKGLDASVSDAVGLYLAAHLVSLTVEKGGLRRDRLGDADQSYKVPGDKDTGLASTRFGQMALMLDTSGTLAALSANKGLKALFSVINTPNDDVLYKWFS